MEFGGSYCKRRGEERKRGGEEGGGERRGRALGLPHDLQSSLLVRGAGEVTDYLVLLPPTQASGSRRLM